MTAKAETFSIGMPVEVGKIDRELKKLWEQGDEKMTRASLMNLAVYSEAKDSLGKNTQIIAQITEDHACRAIVIAADRTATDERVEAWIAAHCHVSGAGSKQVCSEQISFSLAGSFTELLPNIVFSHLDSDLPFYLWWQDEFREPMDPQLWTWVDRLIYDSRAWGNFSAQMRLVNVAQKETNQRLVLCDLNWTRLVQLRLALAQFFDFPTTHDHLAQITKVEIDFASGYRSTAILLLGWLAAQLGWMLQETPDDFTVSFSDCAGEIIRVGLQETEGEPISRCRLLCGPTEFRVTHPAESDLLKTSVCHESTERMHQLMPAGRNDAVALMREELMRGGPHRVYLRAVQAVRALL